MLGGFSYDAQSSKKGADPSLRLGDLTLQNRIIKPRPQALSTPAKAKIDRDDSPRPALARRAFRSRAATASLVRRSRQIGDTVPANVASV
jgi:hypothetical protein